MLRLSIVALRLFEYYSATDSGQLLLRLLGGYFFLFLFAYHKSPQAFRSALLEDLRHPIEWLFVLHLCLGFPSHYRLRLTRMLGFSFLLFG